MRWRMRTEYRLNSWGLFGAILFVVSPPGAVGAYSALVEEMSARFASDGTIDGLRFLIGALGVAWLLGAVLLFVNRVSITEMIDRHEPDFPNLSSHDKKRQDATWKAIAAAAARTRNERTEASQ